MDEKINPKRAFAFQLDPKSALEGMILSGQRVFRGWGRLILIALYAVQSVIIPLGFVGAYFVGYILIFGTPPKGSVGVIVFALLGGGFGFFLNRFVYQQMAKMVCRSTFGRGGHMSFDPAGVVLTTDNSHWRTGWRDVEDLLLGKRSLSIAISGIVLILPLSAFENKDEMERVYADANALLEQGRSAT